VKVLSCLVVLVLTVGLLVGCGSTYGWRRSSVPTDVRTVYVPTFRNESNVPELGAIAARQVLREFQREGTFTIKSEDDAVIEVQGVIKSASAGVNAYDRRAGSRKSSYSFTAEAEVSVIDKRSRRVLVNNRTFSANAFFTAGGDLATAKRDASGRLMEDLARQVVDCVLGIKW